MTNDDDSAANTPVGPDGRPLIGVLTRTERAPSVYKPSRKERLTDYRKRGKAAAPDELDRAAQAIPGTVDYVRLDAPLPAEVVESQVMWQIVARDADRGAWTHALVGENIKATSFASRRRAEGVMAWLRRTSEQDGTHVEYAVVPLLRQEQAI